MHCVRLPKGIICVWDQVSRTVYSTRLHPHKRWKVMAIQCNLCVCVCVCMCIYIYIYIYTHKHISLVTPFVLLCVPSYWFVKFNIIIKLYSLERSSFFLFRMAGNMLENERKKVSVKWLVMINAFIRSESSLWYWATPTGACCTVAETCFIYRPSRDGTYSLNL